jgi:HPt (histidine-containing phosphotransfer) domain-containing protein
VKLLLGFGAPPMKLTDKIRELGLSLQPSEKGYIKKFGKTLLSEKQYQQLDQLLESEILLSTNFSPEEWMYDFLLNGLEEYHKNDRSEIRGMLNQIDVLLLDKDLPEQAEKLIHRAKKSARKMKVTAMQMELSELESALLAIKPPSEDLIERMEKTFEDLQELSDEHDSYVFKKIKDAEK